jgi:phosphoglycolate phosphatase
MKDTLVLFDINGTLIRRDERTDIPYTNAVNGLLGTQNAMDGVDTSARSDKDVLMEVLCRHGRTFSEELWKTFMAMYTRQLEAFFGTDVWRENADAVPFVRRLCESGYPLALITGELSIGARYKLTRIGVWNCFPAGGFGEDALVRFQIAERALEKARAEHQREFSAVYLIGDTVLDIKTARHIGACSIAITTGSHSREKLLAESPDHCIDTFGEVEHLFPR